MAIGSCYFISLASQEKDKRFWILSFISFTLAAITQARLTPLLFFVVAGFGLERIVPKFGLKLFQKLIFSFVLIGILWIAHHANTFSQLMNLFHPSLLLLVLGGVLMFLLKEMKQEFGGLMIVLVSCPIFIMSQPLVASNSLVAMGPWIPCLIPVFSLWIGGFLGMVSRFGKLAGAVGIGGMITLAGINLYSYKSVLWSRDGAGILNFYDGLSKGFLQNDLIFSDDQQIVAVLKHVYGIKINWTGTKDLDVDFQREIQGRLKDGEQTYLLSFQKAPLLRGFNLKLDSVENFRALAIDENSFPPEKKKILESNVRIYRVMSVSQERMT